MLCDPEDLTRSRPQLDYYTVELTPLVNGTMFVSISVSITKGGHQFSTTIVDEEIVDTMRDVLIMIEDSLGTGRPLPR